MIKKLLYFVPLFIFCVLGAHPETAAAATLPQPLNVQGFPDDRVATITWIEPPNAQSNNIVGYVVQWGKVGQPLTGMKQTIHTSTQIQPLENNVAYTVTVKAVQGSYIHPPNGSEQQPAIDEYAVANGVLSDPITINLTPTSARVEAMRARLTGFFDDMNIPAGPLDELLWNHGSTACVEPGEDGQFINGQFHGHNMTRSTCDRDGNISRPRALLDFTGKSESNPAQIEFDFDGISQPRDVWYIDLIPADARVNGMPIDVTSHNDLFDTDHEDPGRMIRIAAYRDKIAFHYYDANNNPHELPINFDGTVCNQGWPPNALAFDFATCNMAIKTPGISPISQSTASIHTVPNVRRHWVIQFSPQKIKLFIDGSYLTYINTPSLFSNITKYQLHWTTFSYNTGKQFNTVWPTTAMVHWDNFGFNGPAPATVVHNYLDGGANGDYPLIARGTPGHLVPDGSRTTKIPIPDSIGSPIKARLMFTIQPFGFQTYTWQSTHKITVNGHEYPFPDPHLNIQSQNITSIAETYIAHATGIYLNHSDLITGQNTVQFSLGSDADILNAHIELEYDKNNAPSHTPPKTIFAANLNSVIAPAMRPNDMYWFVEQSMGLENIIPSPTPPPTSGPTPTPSPTCSLSGDTDCDNDVDIFDYNAVVGQFGTQPPHTADFDHDDDVDIFDYNTVVTGFGQILGNLPQTQPAQLMSH